MHWELERIETLHAGFLRLERLRLRHATFAGGEVVVEREHVERGDAVGVVIHDPARDRLLLVEQFRVGPARRGDAPWMVEIVAGVIDPGETPEDCARREAAEEAGCAIRNLVPLGVVYATPGGSSERFFLFRAEADMSRTAAPAPDADEDVRAFWLPTDTALRWILSGRIRSALPILGLLRAFPARYARIAASSSAP